MGTRSCLLPVRSEDSSDEGFKKWAFMTTHMWGEDPRGKWTLEIKDGGESRSNTGILRDWQLIIHGTREKPYHQNITHPNIPIHRKAVPDDTKNNAKSSVQITQITYTFGDETSPSHSVIPQAHMLQNHHQQQSLYSASQNPIFPSQSILPSVSAMNPFAGLQSAQNNGATAILGAEFNFNQNGNNNNNNNNNNFNFPRNEISSYPGNSFTGVPNYANLFNTQTTLNQLNNPQLYSNTNQQTIANTLAGRSVGWEATNGPQVYTDPNSNLWDFFGRLNRKREIHEKDDKEKKNSLIEALNRIRNLRR